MPYLVLVLVLLGCTAERIEPLRGEADEPSPVAPAESLALEPGVQMTRQNTFVLDGEGYVCSAFAIGEHWAATAAHCVVDGELPLMVGEGPARFVERTLRHPFGYDVALVRVVRPFVDWFELSEFDAAEPGMKGSNGGYGCDGSLRSQDIVFGAEATWTALNCSGDSGGPVLDAAGRVLGTMTHHETGRSGAVGLSLMTPMGNWRTWATDEMAKVADAGEAQGSIAAAP
jgi:hypothetical protein